MCLDRVEGERERVSKLTNDIFSSKIYNCWKNADQGNYGSDVRCYELYVESTAEGISEKKVTSFLKRKGYCQQLPNNQTATGNSLNCGQLDLIKWEIDQILAGDTVIIKYNALAGAIEVI